MNDELISRTEAMKAITEEYNKRLPAEGLKLAYIEKALNEVPGWVPIAEHLPEVKKDPYDKIAYSDYILISFANCPLPSIGRYEQYEDGSGAFFDGDEIEPLSKHGFIVNGWSPLPRCMED